MAKIKTNISHGIYENGYDGRLLFVTKNKKDAISKRKEYIDMLVDSGDFRTSDKQMLRDAIDILPYKNGNPVWQ